MTNDSEAKKPPATTSLLGKVIVLGGAAIGCAAGFYYSNPANPGTNIVVGVIVGVILATWVWNRIPD